MQITESSHDLAGEAIERAYEACAAITRRRARNFYYGLKLTPEPRRSALYAMYAWMRRGDDCVDEAADEDARRDAMAKFRAQTERVLRGDGGAAAGDDEAGAMWAAFADAIRRFNVREADIEQMLAGLEEDLSHNGYETEAEVELYCRRVASSVGSVCVTIWGLSRGADRDAAMEKAAQRGLAFQQTNILRDFAEDFDMGRVYVPTESLRAHGVTAAQVRAWTPADRCRALLESRVARAEAAWERSAGLEEMIDEPCAPALWAMTHIYRGIFEKIKADPERIVSGDRIRLAGFQKATIALRAMVQGRRVGSRT